jgi:hypothetical protein
VLCLAIFGAILSFVLMIVDRKKGGLLWYPENEEKVRKLKEVIDQRTEDRLKEEQYKSCKFLKKSSFLTKHSAWWEIK